VTLLQKANKVAQRLMRLQPLSEFKPEPSINHMDGLDFFGDCQSVEVSLGNKGGFRTDWARRSLLSLLATI
jgi:hypothetical protein